MRARAFAVLVLALALAACPGIPHTLERPTATLQSLTLRNASLSGLDVRAELSIANPNSIAIPLRAVDWELTIADSSPLRGRVHADATIPAKASAPAVADIHISPTSAATMLSRIAAGERSYHLRATLHFETTLGDVAVPIDTTGMLQ
jgi:LEA14-like dessication related protein